MAKKSNKPTREQVYREIMEKEGRKWDDCRVLSFVFEYTMKTELFHFDLMVQTPVYFLFDCWEKNANVVVPKDEQNAAEIVAIAEKLGGQKTMANLR